MGAKKGQLMVTLVKFDTSKKGSRVAKGLKRMCRDTFSYFIPEKCKQRVWRVAVINSAGVKQPCDKSNTCEMCKIQGFHVYEVLENDLQHIGKKDRRRVLDYTRNINEWSTTELLGNVKTGNLINMGMGVDPQD